MARSSIRSIVVGVVPHGAERGKAALAVALDIAAKADAEVTILCLAPVLVAPYSPFGGLSAGLVSEENARALAAAKAFGTMAEERLRVAGLRGEANVLQDDFLGLCRAVARAARVADLAVIEADGDRLPIDSGMLEETVFHSGGPVLLVPPAASAFTAKRVAIAWDGGAQAARAVRDAMPILERAEEVRIISVAEAKKKEGRLPGSDLAHHLARHGFRTTLADLEPTGGDIAATITEDVVANGAGLLVMGVFAHNRLRQLVFGGVTSSILARPPVLTLLSH